MTRPLPPARRRLRLPWPLPALATWLAAWALFAALRGAGLGAAPALLMGQIPGLAAALAWPGLPRWRRLMLAGGFPLSAAAAGLGHGLPAWAWLAPLLLLLLAYPLRAWRDAPLYPTPPGALAGAAGHVALPSGARILDAGCGLGHGLLALHDEWPLARLDGLEWSWPLRLAAALRCRFARVRQGDMWAADWSPYAMVYLFQRPESMSRAWTKACTEMAPGSWLASLDFAVPGAAPQAVIEHAGAPPVWLYRTARVASPRRHGRSTRAGGGR